MSEPSVSLLRRAAETEQMTATKIKRLPNWTGEAFLYRLSPPLRLPNGETTENIIVSATIAFGTGTETYIFASDSDGEADFSELDGSFRGDLDHARALRNIGYEEAPA